MTDISQDPFVNKSVYELEREAYANGVRHGLFLAAEKVRKAGKGMWDHIASLIEGSNAHPD